MSQEIQKTSSNEMVDPATKITMGAFRASFTRDFKDVDDRGRATYISALCNVLDIPTPLNPFYFIPANGKVVLYAGIEAAQLLAESKKLSVEIRSKSFDKETSLYTIFVRVTGPTGRFCDNEGVMFLGGITGDKRANAMMKAITKAHRRAILSYCGLSMTDDNDLEGDYGQPQNPLAERTAQIIEQRAAEPEPETTPQIIAKQITQGDLEARKNLLKFATTGDKPAFKSAKLLDDWVKLKLDGKQLHELNAEECDFLIFELQDEQTPEPGSDEGEVVQPS